MKASHPEAQHNKTQGMKSGKGLYQQSLQVGIEVTAVMFMWSIQLSPTPSPP